MLLLLPIKDRLKREFYAEMCRLEKWSGRTLRAKIGGMLFERTTLSGKPESVIDAEIASLRETDQLTPDLFFRDPYLLDFLGLHDGFSEHDLENAIIREMETFLLELGAGFAFVARQKRMTIDNEDFYLDLLFYHLDLRRFIAIELKLEKFTAAHKGQMELYLRWLNRYERRKQDEAPIGLILCSERSPQQIELLELDSSDIRVAEYCTKKLPPDLRALIDQTTGPSAAAHVGRLLDDAEVEGRAYMTSKGVQIISFSAATQTEMQAAVKPVVEDMLGKLEAKGQPARAIHDGLLKAR